MAATLDLNTNATIANFARVAWDGVSQSNPFWALLKEGGKIEYDANGSSLVGAIEAGRHLPIVAAPGMDLTQFIVPRNRIAQYSFQWSDTVIATPVDPAVLRRNSGDAALYSYKENEMKAVYRDIFFADGGIHHQFLNQNILAPTVGQNAATGLPINGLPSALLAPGAVGLVGSNGAPNGGAPTFTGIAVAATDREAVPGTASQLYGTLSMAPKGSNGVGTGGITGVDSAVLEYDAWTPTLVNTTSTVWNGSANAAANVKQWMQWAISRASRFSTNDPAKKPKMGLSSFDHFQALGNALQSMQTTMLTSPGVDPLNPGTGHNVARLPHGGIWIYWDENMPAATTYIVNTDQIFPKVQQLYNAMESGNPLNMAGEDAGMIETWFNPEPSRRLWVLTASFPGQIIFNPRYQVRCGAYA